MLCKSFMITPGGSEQLDFVALTTIRVLMRDDDDVLWLTSKPGGIDPETSVRIDKALCPFTFVAQGSLFLHSRVQDERTIFVSLVIEGDVA